MSGDSLQIQNARAGQGERPQQFGFAGAGVSAQNDERQRIREARDFLAHPFAIGFVAAVELRRAPTDAPQRRHDRAAVLAAARAIHQRPPFAPGVGERRGAQMARQVGGEQRRAFAPRAVRIGLIESADCGALVVGERRQVARAGDVIDLEFARRARVDHAIEFVHPRHRRHR